MDAGPADDRLKVINRVIAVNRARLLSHAPEIVVYIAVRAVGLMVLAAMASHPGHVTTLLVKWDGSWYLDVARHGYNTALIHRPDGSLVNTDIIFFPLYPLLIAALGTITGLVHASLLVAFVAGIVAAVTLCRIGELLVDKRTGVILAALWGAVPAAVVESMAYTQSLITALAALTVLFLLTERWIAAGATAFLAGLTHSTGLAAAAAIGVCALASLRQASEAGQRRSWNRDWRPWAAAAMGPLGALVYLAWVSYALGRWDGFVYMQSQGWNESSSPVGTWHEIQMAVTHPLPLGYKISVVVLGVAVLGALLVTFARTAGTGSPALPVRVFAWTSLAFALLTGPAYFHTVPRLLIPDFPLLIPLATFLARRSLYIIVATLTACALVSAWYGGYLLTIWTHSP